jgi:small conductance mechanosensitive channel
MDVTWSDLLALGRHHALPLLWKFVVGAAVFVAGRWAARWVVRLLVRLISASKLDLSLQKFLGDLAYALLMIAVLAAALDAVGVQTTAVVAVLGAAGLAVGLALQGSLSNLAAGVQIVTMRPYRVGHSVVIGKYVGRVEAIKMIHTVLITPDHREVLIPNAQIIAQPLENLTTLGTRRLDLEISVAHGLEPATIRRVLEEVAAGDPRIAAEPAPRVELLEVGTDSLRFGLRPWTSVEHHEALAADLLEQVRARCAALGVKFSAVLKTG